MVNRALFKRISFLYNSYISASVIVGLTALLCLPLSRNESYHVVSFILLFIVSFLSTFMSIGPVLLASTLSALVWNFFFIPPHFTFHIERAEDILMFVMFFIIALVNGVYTTRVRRQEQKTREREERTNALFQLTRELSKATGIGAVIDVAVASIREHFSSNIFFILQDGENTLNKSGRIHKEIQLSQREIDIADMVFKSSEKAGRFTDADSGEKYTFYPMPGTRISPGVIVVLQQDKFQGDRKALWDTFLTQISNALEREFLGELAQKARILDESDKLYRTLFNSISHELRIPVSTIMGSADALLSTEHPGNVQSTLYREIFMASVRLNRLIENLLNMSRLESGRISPRLDWYDINDLINKVTDDLKEELKAFNLQVFIPEDMPLVRIDFGLMERVLYNLLINCSEQAPAQSDIGLDILHRQGELIIQVMDRGPGFSAGSIKNVFRKFFRTEGSKAGGLGLGLSIVKGFVEAHKGSVKVENRVGGGAIFTVTIPSGVPDMNNLQMEMP
ncbi:MAG: sensor histidine kinase [Bacteroidota bacterium]